MLRKTWKSVMLAGVAAALLSGNASAQGQNEGLVPFDEFIRGVAAAQTAEHVGRAGNKIAGSQAFNSMRQHILGMYEGVRVRHTFLADGQHYDCVPIMKQPTVRKLRIQQLASPPPALAGSHRQQEVLLDGKDDGPDKRCDTGEIPMRRITLEQMGRFKNLEHFFDKGPDGAGRALPASPTTRAAASPHKYAHAWQGVANYGGSSYLNLWRPPIYTAQTQVFSLAQHWYVTTAGGVTQTVEGGWQNFPQKYGTQNSVLFIYWTPDSYKTGCYNLDCAAFVQVNSSIPLGRSFSSYSTLGGAQTGFTLSWLLHNGNWWLNINSIWVGYYPGSIYRGGALSRYATRIDFGGETVGTSSFPGMGSGQWASSGFGRAAFQNNIKYFANATTAYNASLTKDEPSPRCYTLGLRSNSNTTWGSYFYYGGPGGTVC